MAIKFKNSFLDLHLKMVEDTESPRIFHIYAALAGIAASLGRRCYLADGFKPLYPNLYVALVGPPASKKSTAINIITMMIESVTNIRFAPDDTGGQRQGLMSAMVEQEEDEEAAQLLAGLDMASTQSIEALAGKIMLDMPDVCDKHVLYAAAPELCSLLGSHQIELMTFLNKMFDGDPYKYKLAKHEMQIKDGLMTIIGGITTEQIAETFPSAAIGHGFTSRMILVYGAKKYKYVPNMPPFDDKLQQEVQSVYSYVNHQLHGEFKLTQRAYELLTHLYEWKPNIDDPRFIHYMERRQVHLKKMSLCLAASRRSLVVDATDIQDAHTILQATEAYMPEALGEYGLSKLSVAKQRMIDTLRHMKQAVPVTLLFALMSKDMNRREFQDSVAELINSDKIMQVTLPDHGISLIYKDSKAKQVDDLLTALTDEDDQPGTTIDTGNIIRLAPRIEA